MDKRELRRQLKKERAQVPKETTAAWNQEIRKALLQLPLTAGRIGSWSTFPSVGSGYLGHRGRLGAEG